MSKTMEILIESNLDEMARDIEMLQEKKDRANLYVSMTFPAVKHLERVIDVPGAYFNDLTGTLRASSVARKGNTRRVSALVFNAPHAHLVDAGNQVWEGTDFVARLINENLAATTRAAVRGGQAGWRRFAKRIENQTNKLRLKRVR